MEKFGAYTDSEGKETHLLSSDSATVTVDGNISEHVSLEVENIHMCNNQDPTVDNTLIESRALTNTSNMEVNNSDADKSAHSEPSQNQKTMSNAGRGLKHRPKINLSALVGKRNWGISLKGQLFRSNNNEFEDIVDLNNDRRIDNEELSLSSESSVYMSPLYLSGGTDESDNEEKVKTFDELRKKNEETMGAFINSMPDGEKVKGFACMNQSPSCNAENQLTQKGYEERDSSIRLKTEVSTLSLGTNNTRVKSEISKASPDEKEILEGEIESHDLKFKDTSIEGEGLKHNRAINIPVLISTEHEEMSVLGQLFASNNNEFEETAHLLINKCKSKEVTLSSDTCVYLSPLYLSGGADERHNKRKLDMLEGLRNGNLGKIAAFINSLQNSEIGKQFVSIDKSMSSNTKNQTIQKCKKTVSSVRVAELSSDTDNTTVMSEGSELISSEEQENVYHLTGGAAVIDNDGKLNMLEALRKQNEESSLQDTEIDEQFANTNKSLTKDAKKQTVQKECEERGLSAKIPVEIPTLNSNHHDITIKTKVSGSISLEETEKVDHDPKLEDTLIEGTFEMEDSDSDADEIIHSTSSRKRKRTSSEGKGLKRRPIINISALIGERNRRTSLKGQPFPSNNNEFEETADIDGSSEVNQDDLAGCSDRNIHLSPPHVSGNSDDSDSDDKVETLDEIRKRNEERMAAFINSLRDPEKEKQFAQINKTLSYKAKRDKNDTVKKRQKDKDSSVRFKIERPDRVRKSLRLQNKKPDYCEIDLDQIGENMTNVYRKRSNHNPDDFSIENLEEVVREPKRKSFRRSGFQRKEDTRVIIPVEDVTQEMLKNIALRVKGKVYSQNGTTCHQCRQKTLDQKTCCRNPNCTGIQGMFCGVCIKNRYGEDCAEALLNPNWICPVCRGKCNCSICRNRQGKRPTGVMTPLAFQYGFKCVDHFLTNIRGEGDKPEKDHMWALHKDPEALLGFSDGGRKMHFPNNRTESITCSLCPLKECENPENLLGFSKDGTMVIMGGYKAEPLFILKK